MKNNEQNPPRRGRNPYQQKRRPPLSVLDLGNYQVIPHAQFRRRTNTGRTGGVRRNG